MPSSGLLADKNSLPDTGLKELPEGVESHVRILPLPEDAVLGTGKAEIEGETVKIMFDRRKAKR